MKTLLRILSAICCAFCLPAVADNYGFLKDAPASFFTDQDYQILNATIDRALAGRDNTKLTWQNSQTGASGYIIPKASPTYNGSRCRHLTVYTQAQGRTGLADYRFCKIKNAWRIVN